MGKKVVPLYIKILIGMVGGVLFGVLAYSIGIERFVDHWIEPFGEIFMRSLKLIAIPLVLVSLIRGVSNIGSLGALSKMGVKTLAIYIGTTLGAILIGLSLVLIIQPGQMVDGGSAIIQKSNSVEIGREITSNEPLQMIVEAIPDNFFGALTNNGNMLQVIFIAILIGVSILMIGKHKSAPLLHLIDSLDAIIMKIVDLVMILAPYGVFGLMSGMIVKNASNLSLIAALGLYVLTVVIGLFFLILCFYPLLIRLFGGGKSMEFISKMIPVQLVAFTTSSSAATLPVTMDVVTNDLGVKEKTASFVLPVGVTINMDGTSLYQVVAVVFIAQVMGIELGFMELATIVATTTLSSIGTPGVPGGSIVILVMVLGSVGIPAEGLALIVGLDRPLDMLRTVVNVTGDATVCKIIDSRVKD